MVKPYNDGTGDVIGMERTPTNWLVQCDIEYIDGPLAGVLINQAHHLRYTDRRDAERAFRWMSRVMQEDDFVRAAVTGNRYKIRHVYPIQ